MKKPSFSVFFILIVFSSFISCLCFTSEHILGWHCTSPSNFTENSTYYINLKQLLSSFSSNAIATFNDFYNATTGQDPDKVYGLYLCRGDANTEGCRDCVSSAINFIHVVCFNKKEGIVWSDQCMIRYANRSIFSKLQTYPQQIISDPSNIKKHDGYNKLLADTMVSTATKAENAPLGAKKFATTRKEFTEFQTIYILMQCTPDLFSLDCSSCLRGAIADFPDCCGGKKVVAMLYPSCFLQYELSPFYDTGSASPPNPTVTVLPASQKGKYQATFLLAMVIGTLIAIAISIMLFCYCKLSKRRGRTGTNTEGCTEVTIANTLPFNLGAIQAATNNFANNNLLGQGGFGEVYKGILHDGQEIAVKRLLRSSVQSLQEFKNEVTVVAHLQHKNLVKLLGFCFERNEKMLIFEFVPNKSLDCFLWFEVILTVQIKKKKKS